MKTLLLSILISSMSMADSLLDQAVLLQDQAMHEQALAQCEQLLAAADSSDYTDAEWKVSVLQTIITSLDELGRYDEAIYYCKQIVAMGADVPPDERAYAQADMASFYVLIGHLPQATRTAFEAIKTAKQYIAANNSKWLAARDYDAFAEGAQLMEYVVRQCFTALSEGYVAADEASQAMLVAEFDVPAFKQLFRTSYEQVSVMADKTAAGSALYRMLCSQQQSYGAMLCEAILLEADFAPTEQDKRAILGQIAGLNPTLPDYELRADVRIAASFVQEEKYDSAQVYWERVAQMDSLQTYAAVIEENKAWTAVQHRDWTHALPWLRQSLQDKRQNLKSEFLWLSARSRQRTWLTNYAWYFAQNISLCALAEHPDEVNAFIYDNVLLEKGILLSTETELEMLLQETGGRAVLDSLHALRHIRHQLYLSEKDQTVHPDTLAARKRAAANLELHILRACHNVGDFTRLLDLTWQDVQARLKDHETVVEFIQTEDADNERWMQALVLRKGWSYPKLLTVGKAKEVEQWCASNTLYENKETTRRIWQPIIETAGIQAGQTVYFSPDGIFYLTGIEYLPVDTTTLFDRYNMVRLSSSRELCRQTQANPEEQTILYGGVIYADDENDRRIDYLSSTLDEVQQIDSIIPHSALYTGLEATEESFKDLSGHSPQTLHMATHGFYLKNKKAQSMMQKNVQFVRLTERQRINIEDYALARCGLLMAHSSSSYSGDSISTTRDDGVLTAKEIAALDLHKTELVVLSACKSGLGDITVDGIAGLQRGFKKAGVQAMLMTLWPIDDTASKIFMYAFYQSLVAGQTKQAALRHAQQTLRAMEEYNYPRYWAAFVLLDAIPKE